MVVGSRIIGFSGGGGGGGSKIAVIKAISLDVTDTIIGYRKPIGQIYADAAKWLGLKDSDVPLDDLMTKAFYSSFKEMSKEHPMYGHASNRSYRGREWWRATVEKTFAKAINTGISSHHPNHQLPPLTPLTRVQMDMLFRRIYQEFACRETYELLPDAADFFDKFQSIRTSRGPGQKNNELGKSNGNEPPSPSPSFLSPPPAPPLLVTLGITTNAPLRTVETILPLLGCHRLFDWSVTSEDVGREKPHRDIFSRTLEMARLRDPSVQRENVLHIGDHFLNDFLGARSFGFEALYLDRDSPTGSETDYDALLFKYMENKEKFSGDDSESSSSSSSSSSRNRMSKDEIQKWTIRKLDESLKFVFSDKI